VRERATELAVHFERGQDYRRAVRHLRQAADNVLRRYAYQEAITLLTRGLELLRFLPATPERTQQELALHMALGAPLIATKGWASSEVERTYAQAQALCRQVGETPQLFPVLYGLWVVHYTRAKLPAAQELAGQLLCLAESRRDAALLMEAHHALGNTLLRRGELAAARGHLEQGIALYDPRQYRSHTFLYGLDDGVAGLGYTAWVLWLLGYPDQALQKTGEMLALARELAHPLSLAWALHSAAWHAQLRRERETAREQAEAQIALCSEQGFVHLLATGTIVKGWALAAEGQDNEGLTHARQGLSALQATGAAIGRPLYLGALAEGCVAVGHTDDGFALLAEALAVVEQTGEHFYEAELCRLKGELLLAQESKRQKAKGKNQKSQTLNPGV
jgi:predicted ATPase